MCHDLLSNNNTYAMVTRMAQKPMLGCMDAYNPDTDDWSAYVERLQLFLLQMMIKR